MDEDHRRMGRATTLPVIVSVAGVLVLLSLLRPADAYPAPSEMTITPDYFVYLPYVAKEATPTPILTPTPTPTPQVDLVIWDIDIDPDMPVVGRTFVITVTAKNLGPDDAPLGTYIWLDVGYFHFQEYTEPLAAGATVDMHPSLSLSSAGSYTARGEVDPYDFIRETNEGNNVLEQRFVVE